MTKKNSEQSLFNILRVRQWEDFYGQTKIKEALKIAISAAQKRKEPMEHSLLYGPPGLGKTTLAHLIASEMKVNIRTTSGPALERAGDLASILTNLENKDILFIDEIHRLHKIVEETLYPAMEDYALDIVVGKGPSARTLRLELPHFTLIGATTRIGLLSSPLRDRFGVIHRLNYYQVLDLAKIIKKGALTLKIPIESSAVEELAKRARGTPRIALKLLKRVRDFAQVKGSGKITQETLQAALAILEVDSLGLDKIDRQLILTIIDKFAGGPVGIETLASSLSEDAQTLEEVIEPYLMQLGFLKRTPRGRVVTPEAYKHFQKTPPQTDYPQALLTGFHPV